MNPTIARSAVLASLACSLALWGCAESDRTATPEETAPETTEVVADPQPETQAETPEVVEIESTSEPEAEAKPDYDPAEATRLTAIAKFLAGMRLGEESDLWDKQQTTAWGDRAAALDGAWQQLNAQQLNAARAWAETELSELNASEPVVFYPFSGPDFLYATTFFPKASQYIMVGLEPVGEVPPVEEFSSDRIQQKMDAVNQSLYAIVQFSFFRTKAMAEDLQEQGVTPILMLFAARTNHQILDVQPVGLDGDGELQAVEAGEAEAQGWVPGVKVVVAPDTETGGSSPKTIYYFSTDLSDGGLAQTPQFIDFVQQFDRPVTYLKAASYLMHNESFSTIRDLILDNSQAVLQDDSGIPVRFFPAETWERQFYGNYVRPIELFAERYQSDLRQIYQNDATVKPLGFGIGYKYYDDSNLMLARPQE